MNRYDIFAALTDISDKNLETKPKRGGQIAMRLTAIAAVLALVVGVFVPKLGGKTGGSGVDGMGENESEVLSFMSYAGPILPLTATGGGITAVRDVRLDFSPWQEVWYSVDEMLAEYPQDMPEVDLQEAETTLNELYPKGGYYKTSTDIIATDRYTLKASGESTLIYPFVSSIRNASKLIPTLRLNDAPLDTKLYAGEVVMAENGYSSPSSWTDYKLALEDGSYLSAAFSADTAILETAAVVYRLQNVASPPVSEANKNPTIALNFGFNPEKTNVLSYGFNGASVDYESGIMSRSSAAVYGGDERLLLVIGEDIGEIEIAGYRNGNCEAGNELDGISGTIIREETTVGAIMAEALGGMLSEYFEPELQASNELILQETCRLVSESYATNMDIESIVTSAIGLDRVFYLAANVSLSDGDVLEATMIKEANFDFNCSDSGRQSSEFELLTGLGSSIEFTEISAELLNLEGLEILEQNMGFAPEGGIFRVSLEPKNESYYIIVKSKK